MCPGTAASPVPSGRWRVGKAAAGDAAAANATAQGTSRNNEGGACLPEQRSGAAQGRVRDVAVRQKLPEASQESYLDLLVQSRGRGAVQAWQTRRVVIFSFSCTSVLCNLGKRKVLGGEGGGVCSQVSNSYISNAD